MNNHWIYFATHSDTMTSLWGEEEPDNIVLQGVGKLRINTGCKVFTTSVQLQASCTVTSDVTLKGGDLLTQNCTIMTLCKTIVSNLEGKLQNKNRKTTRQSNTAHIL